MSNDTARAEAAALYGMIGEENTITELRELIGVPPKIERVLRLYADLHPAEAHWIESILKFRQDVANEFERLLHLGSDSEPPEFKPDAAVESIAFAQP